MKRSSQTVRDMARNKRVILLAILGIVLAGSIAVMAVYISRHGTNQPGQTVVQSHRTYHLNLRGAMAYPVNQPTELMFDIRDENNKVLKSFDTVHEKVVHLIVVRKDRAYFQHVHPKFDAASGMFAMTGFIFPTSGEYRVFADFTPSDSQMDSMGMKLAATPYKDVKVGSGVYTAQLLGDDKLTSDTNGLSTTLSLVSDGSSPQPYANTSLTLGVAVTKNGTAYRNLQTYLGALGHMVILGPNLEFIHAHATGEDVNNQIGLITFKVTFPDPGQYRMYLQTQTDAQVNTTDYSYTVQLSPSSQSSQSMPAQDMNMNSMGH